MNEFDDWRKKYETMNYEEQVAYHNDLEKRFPEQAHYNYDNVKRALHMTEFPHVWEFGCWKGDLAQQAFKDFPIAQWTGFEICDDAILNTHCHHADYWVVKPDVFDWWNKERKFTPDVLIATHFIEHLSNQHFTELVKYFKGIPLVYFEAPLSEEGQSWEGYHGTHKLEYGWKQVVEVMKEAGYRVEELLNQGIIFSYESDN